MTTLWTEKTAAEATKGKASGKWQAQRLSIDSRAIQPGDLFLAFKGEKFDGHAYVAEALAKGAVAAVVSRAISDVDAAKLLTVADTTKALEDLGRYARARGQAKIVGVTGSVGKTSTKEMIRLALSAHGRTYATKGNLNNHIGTPLNLANLPSDTPFAVFEMGMNHAGEIAQLTAQVRPHISVITTVEAVHAEFFDSLEGIAKAKAEIFDGMTADGVAVLNRDNPLYPVLVQEAKKRGITKIIGFGEHSKSHCRLIDYGVGREGCRIEADIYGQRLQYTLQAVGRHWAFISLATLAVTHALGLDDEKTVQALADFSELEGRGSIIHIAVNGGEAALIDDSYNASPAAMRAAFAKTSEVWKALGGKGRRLAALGDMLELGKTAPLLHTALVADIEKHGFDGIFTAGALMKHLHEALPGALRAGHADTASQLLPLLQRELKAGDVLLVKGSHGSKIYELASALKNTAPAAQDNKGKKHAV